MPPEEEKLSFTFSATRVPARPSNQRERRAKAQHEAVKGGTYVEGGHLDPGTSVRKGKGAKKRTAASEATPTPQSLHIDDGNDSPLFVRSTSPTPTREMTPSQEDQGNDNNISLTNYASIHKAGILPHPAHEMATLDKTSNTPVPTIENNLADAHTEGTTMKTVMADYVSLDVREHYRDHRGIKREVWRPGDGDGDPSYDFCDDQRTDIPRWRFFQHDIGPLIKAKKEPPKYVLLDDKAAYEVFKAEICTKMNMGKFWNHDFSNVGHLKTNRPNRGRAALMHESGDGAVKIDTGDGQGERIVATLPAGQNKSKLYRFIGERGGYASINYAPPQPRESAPEPSSPLRRSVASTNSSAQPHTGDVQIVGDNIAKKPATNPPRRKLRQHEIYGYTTGERRHKRPAINTYLKSTPSPPWPGGVQRMRLTGKRTSSVASSREDDSPGIEVTRGESSEPARKRTTVPALGQTNEALNNIYDSLAALQRELDETRAMVRDRDEEIVGLKVQLQLLSEG